MKILDLDMDYFMNEIACNIAENEIQRLDEMNYGDTVWSEQRVRDFLEQNLGLNDYLVDTLKNFEENYVWDSPVENIIQLTHNPNMELPAYYATDFEKKSYLENCIKEPEVPLLIIPTIEAVNFNGDFDYAVMAQSPNYTPASADFIIDIFKEYIVEC